MDFQEVSHVISIHDYQVRAFGGLPGIRDHDVRRDAVLAPIDQHVNDQSASLYDLGTTYAYYISRYRPFTGGNKRTGLTCALVSLDLNETDVHTPERVLLQMMEDLATEKRSRPSFAAYLAASPI